MAVKKTERRRIASGGIREGEEEVDGKGGECRERVERPPCSPSDALLKVKVFHPSLVRGRANGWGDGERGGVGGIEGEG